MWSLNNNVILSSGDDPTRTVDDVMVENLYVEANKFALVCTELCGIYVTRPARINHVNINYTELYFC